MSNVPGGKGSSPRPFSVDRKTFNANWDQIFGKKKEDQKSDQQQPKQKHQTS